MFSALNLKTEKGSRKMPNARAIDSLQSTEEKVQRTVYLPKTLDKAFRAALVEHDIRRQAAVEQAILGWVEQLKAIEAAKAEAKVNEKVEAA